VKLVTNKIPKKSSLKRLFLYRICLNRMKKMDVNRIYSYTLGHETGVSPEQVRKDFSEYKIRGNQRGGYETDILLNELELILRQTGIMNTILVGMGNIGQALARYNWLNQRNINLVATFDVDPKKQIKRSETAIYPMERLAEIVLRFSVKVAIITVPDISAQEVCNQLIAAGIKGIVNFAPIILKIPQGIVVNNVNLYDEVESVFYWVENNVEK